MKWILMAIVMTSSAFADLQKAPANFKVGADNMQFIDITSVDTKITYDIKAKKTTARTTVTFKVEKTGMPIFDLIPEPTKAQLDGMAVSSKLIFAPGDVTKYRAIDKNIKAGVHTLYIENEFNANTKYAEGAARSGFWMSDLADRKYIEQYIPTNIEYDQYSMDMEVKVLGKTTHEVFTNGSLKELSKNHFMISFPKYFTASSFYFHLSDRGRFGRVTFEHKSINGKSIPGIVYTGSSWTNIEKQKEKALRVLKELERNLGPWSHESVIIYIAGSGGMEHSGATITSTSALGHELTHSYFARGVMPIDGNSGWMDEAIASWRDNGYRSMAYPNFNSTQMSGHSSYRRTTDRKAYSKGEVFMRFLNNELEDQGGLIKFLSIVYKKYVHKNITTTVFKKELEQFSGRDFTAEFNQFIFGTTYVNSAAKSSDKHEENPYHPQLSKQDLLNLL